MPIFFPYDHKTLLDILDGLFFHIAKADGVVHESEIGYLSRVAEVFGLSEREFAKSAGPACTGRRQSLRCAWHRTGGRVWRN
ncbi:TerB family tellurite resistance protein [Roseibium salinum]|nr:TerB family tellurite resistance protein [Roseibium salinum]